VSSTDFHGESGYSPRFYLPETHHKSETSLPGAHAAFIPSLRGVVRGLFPQLFLTTTGALTENK
jgi:hypothetical protein